MSNSVDVNFNDVLPGLKAPDRILLLFTLAFFATWLGSAGPLRWWASDAGMATLFVFGVAPSFFAGATFTCWISLATRTGPLVSGILSLGITVLGEGGQLLVAGHSADIRDVVAGALGAVISTPVVRCRTPGSAPR